MIFEKKTEQPLRQKSFFCGRSFVERQLPQKRKKITKQYKHVKLYISNDWHPQGQCQRFWAPWENISLGPITTDHITLPLQLSCLLQSNAYGMMLNVSELWKYNTVQTFMQRSAHSRIHYLMQDEYALKEMYLSFFHNIKKNTHTHPHTHTQWC